MKINIYILGKNKFIKQLSGNYKPDINNVIILIGVAVKQSTLNEGENIINADDLKAGVYIWKTSSNNIVNSGKLIKK